MNPMAAMAVGAFLSKFPGLANLITKFPNFNQETKDLLIAYVKKLSESQDPEALLASTLKEALTVKAPKVVVVEQKPLPKSRR